MNKLAAVIAVAVFASGAASASDKTDAMAVVHKWVDSFNKGDGKTGSSYCVDGALIIDDLASHYGRHQGHAPVGTKTMKRLQLRCRSPLRALRSGRSATWTSTPVTRTS